jgi:hypothetical protein
MSTPENTKDAKAKCPAKIKQPNGTYKTCNKDHRVEGDRIGDSVGKSSVLAANLGGAPNHHEYDGPRTLAAHHLICGQILYSKRNPSSENDFWETVCHAYGYNINCEKNGIFLPRKMYLACVLNRPLHRGNHDSAETFDGDLPTGITYTKQVRAMLEAVRKDVSGGLYCKNRDALIADMEDISSEIKDFINEFTWTLTSDGRDYMPEGIGCCNYKSITTKTLALLLLRGKRLVDVSDKLTEIQHCKRKHKLHMK